MSYFGNKDFLVEVQKGNIPKHSIVNKFGASDNVTTSWTIIATGEIYPTPTTAQSLEIVSDDNTNDISSGTGARKVEIQGLDASWNPQTQTVSLNGTTAASVTGTWFRVYRMKVTESGSYATTTTPSHNSTITTRVSGGGATWAQISPDNSFGLGQSEIGGYTVPTGYTGYMLGHKIDVEANKPVDVTLFVRENADDVTTPYTGVMQAKSITRGIEGEVVSRPTGPELTLVGPCDVSFMARVQTGTAAVECEFQILLVQD